MIGAEVKEGDILVGKISPKGFVEYSPEEKLLNVIFGNKSHGYRDSSLSVKHGEGGIVIGVKRFKSIDGDLLDDLMYYSVNDHQKANFYISHDKTVYLLSRYHRTYFLTAIKTLLHYNYFLTVILTGLLTAL